MKRLALAAAITFSATPALAQEPAGEDTQPEVEERPEAEEPARDPHVLPAFMAQKKRMSDADVKDKTEGGYFTGLPLVNSDPDTGIGFGARVLYYQNGIKDDAMFAYTPYRSRAFAQAFFTTNGYQYHTVDYDGPYIYDMPVRLRANVVFEKNTAANYFGTGSRAQQDLAFAGDPRSFAHYTDYNSALRAIRPDGSTFARFDQYVLTRPSAQVSVERDFFGGVVRAQAGFRTSYATIGQWTGESVDTDSGKGVQAQTRLGLDCAAGIIRGCEGGFVNALRFGLAYDTRDFEPDPNSGVFIDATTDLSARPLGSDYDFARVTVSPRVYVSPFPKLTDLVVAARLVGVVQSKGTPFFAMNQISFSDGERNGLGGLRTLRGYRQDRFIGNAVALANLELRWTFYEFGIGKNHPQHFGLMLVPFLDTGRVFDAIDDFTFKDFKVAGGAGFRIGWNQATVIVIDYGKSSEDTGLYVNFNHPF